jgi:hypothetical protein
MTYDEWYAVTRQHPEWIARFIREYQWDYRAGEPHPLDREVILKLFRSLSEEE